MKVDLSCPIELWAYELPTREKPVCSFTFFNLGRRAISSIQITITCFDAADQVLSRRVERPMALGAVGRETFYVEVYADGLAVEALDLTIDKTWFEDGSEWRRAQEARLVEYKPNELPPNRRLEQLRYIAGSDAAGYPSDQGAVWICVCGRVNASEEQTCRRCSRKKDEVFERFSFEAVKRENDRRERELEQKARLAREEASQQEFLRQTRARRKKRNRRIRTGVFCATIIISGVVYLFVVLGLPEIKYQTAMAAMASGDPFGARADFEALSAYRDAQDMIKECDLRIAQRYIASGNLEQVNEGIAMLEALGTYPGASDSVVEGNYQKAVVLMNEEEFAQASDIFYQMKDYRDADTMHRKAEYQLATQEMNRQEYEAARVRFLSLGPQYSDALAQANNCVYLPAQELMHEEKFDEAAELFNTIQGFLDASAKWQICIYQSASRAHLSGDYQRAAELFMQVSNYEDADEWVKKSVYLLAGQFRDDQDYEKARSLYANVPGYEDADEQVKACAYLPAEALMAEKKYEEAAALFSEIPGYLDATELYGECLYLAGKAALTAKDYEKAIDLFESAQTYSDSEKQLLQARYSYAEELLESANFDEAVALFELLGDYEDAPTRAKKALYAKAEAAFAEGDYGGASEQFAALSGYSDAEDRVKACQYEIALLTIGGGDLTATYEELIAIEDYEPALKKAQEVAYTIGDQLEGEGDLVGAYEAFDKAGKYQDAADRRDNCVYKRAQSLMDGGSYQEAGALFNTITTYADSRTKRDECYDMWLSIRSQTAQGLYQSESYEEVIQLLAELDMETLPKAYESLRTMYYDSNHKLARKYIDEGRALDAYPYLVACKGYKNASELLTKTIYRILGTWETEMGVRYAFYLNGTCNIAGKEMLFNMLNAYGIYTGETEDSLERTLSFSSGSEDTMTLRVIETNETVRLHRVRPAEHAPSEEEEGGIKVTYLDDAQGEAAEGDEAQEEAEEEQAEE